MATKQEVDAYYNQLINIDRAFTAIGQTPQGRSQETQAARSALTQALSRIQGLSALAGRSGTVPDDQFNSAKGFSQNILSQNSDAIRKALGAVPGPTGGDYQPTLDQANQAVTNTSGVQPGQYVDPTSGQSGPVPPPSSAVDPVAQQGATDQALIEQEGQRQYQQQQDFITSDAARREAARQQMAQLLTKQAQESFSETLPLTAEDYNAGHLLNSSGYGNEVARQQGSLAQQIANKLGETGLQDVNLQTQQQQDALGGLLGYQSSGLNRNFSLQDFQRQAQLSREIGAMSVPQTGGGKGAVGSTLQGVGALAPYAFLATGNPGMAAATAGVSNRTQASGGGK